MDGIYARMLQLQFCFLWKKRWHRVPWRLRKSYHCTHLEEEGEFREYRPVSLTTIPENIVYHASENLCENMWEGWEVIQKQWPRCTKGKSYLTNLSAFCNYMTNYVDVGTFVDIVFPDFDFSEVFIISHWRSCGSMSWQIRIVRWIVNCVDTWVQRIVFNSSVIH